MTHTHAFVRIVLIATTVVALSACVNSRNPHAASDTPAPSTPSAPAAPGMYNMTVTETAADRGSGRSQGKPYSGPATFSAARGGTLIVLWADSTFTTSLVELFRQAPVTSPVTCYPLSLLQATRKAVSPLSNVVVKDNFTDPNASLSGEIRITAVSDTSLTATMSYKDSTAQVPAIAGSFNAIRR